VRLSGGSSKVWIVILRLLDPSFSRSGHEQLRSSNPIFGPTHPLSRAKEMRTCHPIHATVPRIVEAEPSSRCAISSADHGHHVADVLGAVQDLTSTISSVEKEWYARDFRPFYKPSTATNPKTPSVRAAASRQRGVPCGHFDCARQNEAAPPFHVCQRRCSLRHHYAVCFQKASQ
jgi:hypothetical protein